MKNLLNQEVVEELQDVLNQCDECYGTLNQHMLMCSNHAHRAIAYVLSNWNFEELPAWEREEFENDIANLQDEVWELENRVSSQEKDIDELNEKLEEYSHLKIEDLKNEIRRLKYAVNSKTNEIDDLRNKLKVWSAIDPKEVKSTQWR